MTEGPWRARGLEVVAHGLIVCEVTGGVGNPSSVADAALIAAAPDMRDVLEALVGEIESWADKCPRSVIRAAQAARSFLENM